MSRNDEIDKILKAAGKKPNPELEQKEEYVNQDAVNRLKAESQRIEDLEDRTIEAGVLGAARGLSFGLTDQALVKSGIYSAEELNDVKKHNEIASLTGEIGATAAAIIGTGGTGALAKGVGAAGKGVQAASKAGLLAEKAFAAALAKEGKKSIAREIVRRSAPKMLGSAVEGAMYGAGQLISENALGNAEINAENILASTGTGALLGGAAAGIFSIPKALAPLTKKAGSAVKSKLTKEPAEALEQYLSYTPKELARKKAQNPRFFEEGAEWLAKQEDFSKFTSDKDILTSMITKQQKNEKNISAIYDKAEDFLKNKINSRITNKTIPKQTKPLARLASTMDEFVNKFKNDPNAKTDLVKARRLRDSYLQQANKNKNLSIKDLWKRRKDIDERLFKKRRSGQFDVEGDMLKAQRTVLNEEIKEGIKAVGRLDDTGSIGNLVQDLLEANKEYSFTQTFIDAMEKKTTKAASKSSWGLRDIALMGSAALFDPSTAALAVGTKKLLESDFRKRAIILSSIEKQNKAVDNKISSSINQFFGKVKKAEKAIKSSSTRALINSNLSIPLEDKKKKPKTRKEAFKNVSNNITELISNPEKLQETVARRTIHLNNVAPETTNAAVVTAIKGLEFLNSKMPKPTTDVSSSNLFTKREFEPSQLQLSKFERYVQAVENPMSAVDDLKDGTLTREAAEAIQVVYPNLFAKMQEQVIETVQDPNVKIDYNKRLQLGILMNIPTDSSLMPANIASLQNNIMFQEAEQPSSATAAKAENLDIADRRETKANQIAQK